MEGEQKKVALSSLLRFKLSCERVASREPFIEIGVAYRKGRLASSIPSQLLAKLIELANSVPLEQNSVQVPGSLKGILT